MSEQPDNTRYLATAIHYLQVTQRPNTAKLLLTCTAEFTFWDNNSVDITLRGTPEFVLDYRNEGEVVYERDGVGHFIENLTSSNIREAFEAVFPDKQVDRIIAGISLIDVDTDWRTQLLAEDETREAVTNQNPWVKKPTVWKGMKFDPNSPGELAIAQSLDRMGILYLPNCLVRVGAPNNQQTFFPDFLICHNGKWGILEVDGQKYHQGTATQDYERMRKLIQHIAHFDRYPSQRCVDNPDGIIKEFLSILAKK